MDWAGCIYIFRNTYTHICKTKRLKTIFFYIFSIVYVCSCVHAHVPWPTCGQSTTFWVDSSLLLCGQGHWAPLIKLGGKCLYPLSLLLALKQTLDQEPFVSCQQLSPVAVDWWIYQLHKWDLSVDRLRLTSRSLPWKPGSCHVFDLMPLLKGRNGDREHLSSIKLTLYTTHFLEPSYLGLFISVVFIYWVTSLQSFFKKNGITYLLFCARVCMYVGSHTS